MLRAALLAGGRRRQKVAVTLENTGVVLNAVAFGEDREAGFEGFAIERASRCDDGDRVAGVQSACSMKNRLRRQSLANCSDGAVGLKGPISPTGPSDHASGMRGRDRADPAAGLHRATR